MFLRLPVVLAVGIRLAAAQFTTTPGAPTGQFDPQLAGTWSSKSNKTFTGPGFYNPLKEQLIEPSHTGISYSFTGDGFYEVAYYRAIANPVNPACPGGIMQWQHGQYEHLSNGSVVTQPFAVDGRQLLSQPCDNANGIYTRYNQSELFSRYERLIDPYHNVPRLNLYRFDGSPIMPLYLAFQPPMMLPTSTLDPTDTPSSTGPEQEGATTQTNGRYRLRRRLNDFHQAWKGKRGLHMEARRESPLLGRADTWFWFGLISTGVGSVMYFFF